MKEFLKKWKWPILAVAAVLLAIWLWWENTALVRTDYTVASERLPEAFDGIRIVQVSDLHNTEFGTDNKKLLQIIRDAQPDIIALTGDLIDSRRTNVELALEFVREAVKIAPCYYVTGNHEIRDDAYPRLEEGLIAAGVTVLRGEAVTLERDSQRIRILGVDDPTILSKEDEDHPAAMAGMLADFTGEDFTILLSHRPELFDVYCQYGMDVVLSGHAHGGQIRLPEIGGVYASEGLFPTYDAGHFHNGTTNMIVSRGLGNSLFPVRINNRPEVVVVTLVTK